MTLSMSIMTLSIMTLSSAEHQIKSHPENKNVSQHISRVLLQSESIIPSLMCAECRKSALYAECRYGECRYTECRCTEYRGALRNSFPVFKCTSLFWGKITILSCRYTFSMLYDCFRSCSRWGKISQSVFQVGFFQEMIVDLLR